MEVVIHAQVQNISPNVKSITGMVYDTVQPEPESPRLPLFKNIYPIKLVTFRDKRRINDSYSNLNGE